MSFIILIELEGAFKEAYNSTCDARKAFEVLKSKYGFFIERLEKIGRIERFHCFVIDHNFFIDVYEMKPVERGQHGNQA